MMISSVVGHISRYTVLLYVSPAGLCNLSLSGTLLTEFENNFFIPVPNIALCNTGMFYFRDSEAGIHDTLLPFTIPPHTFQAQGKCSCPPEKEGKLEVCGDQMLIFPRLSYGA